MQHTKLDSTNAASKASVPVKILKGNSEIFSESLQSNLNGCLAKLRFPEEQNAGDISDLFEKLVRYRGGSRLSHRTHMRQSEFEIYVLGLYISFILTPISNSN